MCVWVGERVCVCDNMTTQGSRKHCNGRRATNAEQRTRGYIHHEVCVGNNERTLQRCNVGVQPRLPQADGRASVSGGRPHTAHQPAWRRPGGNVGLVPVALFVSAA